MFSTTFPLLQTHCTYAAWLNLTGEARTLYLNDYEMGQDMLEPGRWDT